RRRPLLPLARREARDHRAGHAGGRRQRRRVPVDDRELQVALRSLYREPERREEITFGALEFHDVFKIYRSGPAETVALRGLDLRIEAGELVAVLGPSGSGKSTFLHLAAGLEQPSAGEVRIFGQPLNRLEEGALAAFRARRIAIVFQSENLLPLLTARENVATATRLGGNKDPRAAAGSALAAVDLDRRATHRPGALSGGEQQR